MRKTTLKEMQQLELEIMKDVHAFCEENNIRYYLASGTLLGAIRHKGFIPWDDDIDITMPRPDYDRFINTYKPKSNYYTISSIETNDNHLFTFTKIFDNRTMKIEENLEYRNGSIGGVEIDIFPIDGLPEDTSKSDKYFIKFKKIYRLYSISASKFIKYKNIFKTLARFIVTVPCKLIGVQRFIKYINNKAKKYSFDNSKYVGCVMVPFYGKKERMLKQDYIEQIKVDFEGEKFYASKGYDKYLSNLYGDYMKLPPEKDRVTHHRCKVYWK